jgi:hypothetical protein
MASEGNLLSDKAVEQVNKTVREVARRMMNLPQERARWHFQGGSGGGSLDIEFTVISMNCYSTPWILTVEVTWFSGGCTASIPGADDYTGYVEVENRCNIANLFTSTNIVGLTGTATYRYPRTGTCTPAWRLDDICGEGICPL